MSISCFFRDANRAVNSARASLLLLLLLFLSESFYHVFDHTALTVPQNVSYWQGRDPASYGEADWGWKLRQGPPGAVAFCSEHGLLKRPGSDFLYSYANPALAEGVLKATTGMGYAEYRPR